ncbi:hypothetical protein ACFPME_07080 [Rhodanobacter umsongensis]|uniref:Phage infection protein n=1 Tax=Rhodanobacter umsongensis TaxID=633153 RepID=A0ABW0JK87_9GAMM
MHKTILATLVIGASTLSIPAFAQVNLGGAAQVGAGVNTGAVVPHTIHSIDHAGAQATQRAGHKARHLTHKAVDSTRSTVNGSGRATAGGSADAGAGHAHAGANANIDTGAGVDTANTAGQAGAAGHGVGGEVRDAAHSAIRATDRSAGAVGDAVRQTAAGQSVEADAKVNANAAHGH